MEIVPTVLQVIVALGLLNVWLLRAGKATRYRGGNATSIREEFTAYGLPVGVMYVVGGLKVMIAVALLVGIWRPVLVTPAAAVLILAAWLLRDGLRAEAAYNDRKVARRHALPRKMLASALTGIGVAMASYASEPGILAPAIFGVVATLLHGAAFGIQWPFSQKPHVMMPVVAGCAKTAVMKSRV